MRTMLALDTSSAIASAAILRDGAVIAERCADSDRKHEETILPLVQALLVDIGMTLTDVDCFAVDVGPGSFTGVRIGVCMANALAYAGEKRVIGVNALRTLAQPFDGAGERVCTLIDARSGNAYAAQFAGGACLAEPAAVALAEYLPTVSEGTRFVGDIVPQCGEGETLHLPTAGAVALVAWTMQDRAAESVLPLYLRVPQAERIRAERSGR